MPFSRLPSRLLSATALVARFAPASGQAQSLPSMSGRQPLLNRGNSATIADTREAQARFDLATAQEIAADNDWVTKRIALDELVGHDNVEPEDLAVPVALPVSTAGVDDLASHAVAEHPSVRRAQVAYDVALLETEKARAQELPTVAVPSARRLEPMRALDLQASLVFVVALAAGPAMAADFPCLIEARQQVGVRPATDGVIESMMVERGDWVKKGQVLVTMQAGPERAAVELARARANSQGELKTALMRQELADKKLARAVELQQQHFLSANGGDEASAEAKLAAEQVRLARENLELARLDSKRTSEVLAMRTVRSPFDGVVVDVVQRPGEFSGSNVKDPMLKLAEIDPLYVEVVLPVAQLGSIKVGAKARVTAENPVGAVYEATVKVVDSVIDAASGTFGVRLQLANPAHKIPAGIACTVRF